jgi:hypothetical protein
MKNRVLWFGIVFFSLVALPLAGGVAGGKARPFKAHSIVYFSTESDPDYNAIMVGQATHLGMFEGRCISFYDENDPEGPSNWGSGVLLAAWTVGIITTKTKIQDNKTFTQLSLQNRTNIGAAVGTYVITGGTGRFLNSSGQGTYIAVIDLTYSNPPEFTFDGTIVY